MRRLAIALLVALATACTGPATSSRSVVVVGTVNSPTTMDPLVGLDETSQRIHQLLFSSLLTISDDLRIVPDLAVRFDTTDAQNYTAAIPPGVRFHNGREMTSADVAYTFRRFIDPKFVSGKKGAFHDLQSVDIVDRYTVVFRLKTRSGAFPSSLTNLGIVPEGTGAEAGRAPIGSGPYRLKEFVPDDHVTLDAFADYYRGAPANPGIVIRVVPDDTMRGLELRKGDVDLVVNDLAPDLIHSLRAAGRLNVVTSAGTDFAYIGLNLRDPLLGNSKVRQAIGYAIDRGAIVRYLRRDLARPASGIIPDVSWAYSPDLFSFTYDPARAKALLDDAGYRDPDGDGPLPRIRLTFKTSTAEQYRLQAAVLQEQLSHVGIALDIRSYEFATLFTDIVKGNFQMYTLVFSAGAASDPDILRRVFHSQQVPPGGFNRGYFSDPEVDRLIDEASQATDYESRKRLYGEVQKLIAEAAPYISLWHRTNFALSDSKVHGIRLTPQGDFTFLRNVSR